MCESYQGYKNYPTPRVMGYENMHGELKCVPCAERAVGYPTSGYAPNGSEVHEDHEWASESCDSCGRNITESTRLRED